MKKTRPAESFFNFFSPPSPPPEDPEEDVLDEDEFEELEEKLEMDYQLGEDFKEKVGIFLAYLFRIFALTDRFLYSDHTPRSRLLHRQSPRVRDARRGRGRFRR